MQVQQEKAHYKRLLHHRIAVWHLTTTQRKRARHKACYDAFGIGYRLIWGVLDKIIEDSSEKAETKAKFAGISNMFGKFKNGFITELWDCVLPRFDAAAKVLQSASVSLNNVV